MGNLSCPVLRGRDDGNIILLLDGKTQIALEYVYCYRAEYRAVLWLCAETTKTLNASYRELAAVLGLPEREVQEQDIVVQAVHQRLRQIDRWLLIVDNADDLARTQAFVPIGVAGHLIFTTKSHITGKMATRLEVGPLEIDMGAHLLLCRAGLLAAASDADLEVARAIARELGGLPLALDQAGAYIENYGCSLTDYLQRYQTLGEQLLAQRVVLVDDHPESVATTWLRSFAKVEQTSPTAAELLRACAFLAPDAIPEELLIEILQVPRTPASPEVPQRKRRDRFSRLMGKEPRQRERPSSDTSREAIQEAIAVLRSYSLLQRKSGEQIVAIHQLVQTVIRDLLDERTQATWITHVVGAVSRCFPVVCFETWERCEVYLQQALVCHRWLEQRHLQMREEASLLHQAAWYLVDRARYTEAEPLLVRALYIQRKLWGNEHPDTAASLTNLALLYHDQGKDAEAEPLFVQTLEIYEQVLGADHPNTVTSLHNLASLYMSQGKHAEAEPLFLQALSTRENVLGANHPATAATFNNLALLYQDQGKYTEAESLFLRALAIRENVLGARHPDTAASLTNLALLYQDQGKHAEVEPLFHRALAIRENVLGTRHPDTAASLHNLALLYLRQGEDTEAETLLLRALAIRENVLRARHPDTAASLHNLALLYRDQGKFAESEPLLLRALTTYEHHLGARHPTTLTVHANYTALVEAMKQTDTPED